MVQEYYAFQGWDENGVPREETLSELGITPDFISLSV